MRFITCRLPDGIEDPAILSSDGKQVWPLSWLGLSYETLSDAIPFLTPQVRAGLSLAIMGIPALPIEAVTLESPIPSPAQDVICLGINYMAHSDEAENILRTPLQPNIRTRSIFQSVSPEPFRTEASLRRTPTL